MYIYLAFKGTSTEQTSENLWKITMKCFCIVLKKKPDIEIFDYVNQLYIGEISSGTFRDRLKEDMIEYFETDKNYKVPFERYNKEHLANFLFQGTKETFLDMVKNPLKYFKSEYFKKISLETLKNSSVTFEGKCVITEITPENFKEGTFFEYIL